MDPSVFLQYSPPTGLPQESKLATYMNRSTSTPTRSLNQASLNQALGKLSLDSSPTTINKVMIGEYVPYYSPTNIHPESPENTSSNQIPGVPTNQVHQENVGGTTYFYSTNSESLNSTGGLNSSASMGAECMGAVAVVPTVPSAYASQMYAATPTNMAAMIPQPAGVAELRSRARDRSWAVVEPSTSLSASFSKPDVIRSEIYERNEQVLIQPDPHQYPDLPTNVEMYTELTPLEDSSPHALTSSFRVVHRETGEMYAIRRLHGCSTTTCKRFEMWKQIDHPNIVRLYECFPTASFGDHSMVMLYDYHPASATLMQKFMIAGAGPEAAEANGYHDPFSSDPDAPRPYTHQKNAMLRAVASGALLPEAIIWSVLVQLTSALRAIHSAGLACRTLDATKVVMTGCRVRVSWCGVADVLHPNINDIGQAQQEDLNALGRLALALACRSIHCDNLPASIDVVARNYSADLKNLILYLLSASPTRRSVTDLMPMIGARFYTQVEALERRADTFEGQLAIEIDNGRLLRILIKLGIVNERPELNMAQSWSETGNRYMLKLFRDYLFHAVTSDGRPWIDQAHLVYCLNQLDTGAMAKVELMSRDEQSVLVVTYSELKYCLETAFDEVMTAAGSPVP